MKANNPAEAKILAYFEANASEDLKKRVEEEKKTPAGALHYCSALARKQSVNGCACIDDDTVYGWAMHYFEDEKASNHEGKVGVARVSTSKLSGDELKKVEERTREAMKRGNPDKKKRSGAIHPKKPAKPEPPKEPQMSKRETKEREGGQLFLFDAIMEPAK